MPSLQQCNSTTTRHSTRSQSDPIRTGIPRPRRSRQLRMQNSMCQSLCERSQAALRTSQPGCQACHHLLFEAGYICNPRFGGLMSSAVTQYSSMPPWCPIDKLRWEKRTIHWCKNASCLKAIRTNSHCLRALRSLLSLLSYIIFNIPCLGGVMYDCTVGVQMLTQQFLKLVSASAMMGLR